MASAIPGHILKANTKSATLRDGLARLTGDDLEHELNVDHVKHSEANTVQPRHAPGQHAPYGQGNPQNQLRRERERFQRLQRDASAQRFQQLEQMIVSDVAIFNELMEKAHDRYMTIMDRYTTNTETIFNKFLENQREFQHEFRVHLQHERDREYATIKQLLNNILETRVNALSREADAGTHHEVQRVGADATGGQKAATSCS